VVHDYLKIIAMGKVPWDVAYIENSQENWDVAALVGDEWGADGGKRKAGRARGAQSTRPNIITESTHVTIPR